MPNWCSNSFVITSANDEMEAEFNSALKKGLFNAFVPHPDWENTPNSEGELPKWSCEEGQGYRHLVWANNKADERWYNWNCENWGTKWDVWGEETHLHRDGEAIHLSFDTAWSPPIAFLISLSEKYPESNITLHYSEEGCDFMGVTVFRNGKYHDECISPEDLFIEWAKRVHNIENLYDDDAIDWDRRQQLREEYYDSGVYESALNECEMKANLALKNSL